MTFELICDNCGKMIPEGINHIEYDNGIIIFCSEKCEDQWNSA